MQRFNAGSFSFLGPSSWQDVTLAQLLKLADNDAAKTAAFVISTLSNLSEEELRGKSATFDLKTFVLNHLAFIYENPEIPDVLPKQVTIAGQTYTLPHDLGATALLGQMWDVDLVIESKQSKNLPVTPVTMAETLLPVFLWPLLQSEPYTNRHKAAELWPLVSSMPCIEALAVSSFFLRNILSPFPSGLLSVETLPSIHLKSWRQKLYQVWRALTSISQRSN